MTVPDIVWWTSSQTWGPKMRAAAILRHIPGAEVWLPHHKALEPLVYAKTPYRVVPSAQLTRTPPRLLVVDVSIPRAAIPRSIPYVYIYRAGARPDPRATLNINVENLLLSPHEAFPSRGMAREHRGYSDTDVVLISAGSAYHAVQQIRASVPSAVQVDSYPLVFDLLAADGCIGNAGWGLKNDLLISEIPHFLVSSDTAPDQGERSDGTVAEMIEWCKDLQPLDRDPQWVPQFKNSSQEVANQILALDF